jgi:predicted cobalt transporter CbtA
MNMNLSACENHAETETINDGGFFFHAQFQAFCLAPTLGLSEKLLVHLTIFFLLAPK